MATCSFPKLNDRSYSDNQVAHQSYLSISGSLSGRTELTYNLFVARKENFPRYHAIHTERHGKTVRTILSFIVAKCHSLTSLTQKDMAYLLTEECDAAYRNMIQVVSSEPVLCLCDFAVLFEPCAEAIRYITGAVLYQ